MVDLRSNWKPYWREKDASKKEDFKAQLLTTHFPQYFQKYSKVLERNGGEWLVSSRLTWADLYVAHFLEFFHDYPELKSFKDKIFETPEIKAWTAVRPKTIL
jgi:glutathione S-transferase